MEVTDCKNIMVYIESADGKPVNVGLEMLSPAKEIAKARGGKVIGVLIGKNLDEAAKAVSENAADEVVTVETSYYNGEMYTAILEKLINKYSPSLVLLGGSQFGKEMAPRLAARFKSGCFTDAIDMKMDGKDVVWTCPLYGGTVLTDVKLDGKMPEIGTVRSGSFKKISEKQDASPIIKEDIDIKEDDLKTKVKDTVKEISETINLEEADVIVSGGRGMGNAENFKLIQELADLLHGVVGASRPAIEAEWVSRAHQVGQSGKIVSPKLYIACGISGATQHVSGMIGSDYIVAINKDEDAPIFDVANVGIVGDAMQVIPAMIEEIKKVKQAD